MAEYGGTVQDQATSWHLRLADADADAWAAFAVWLEADPAHADAYDAVALADDDLEGLAAPAAVEPEPLPGNVVPLRRHGRRAFLGLAVAAGISAVVGVGLMRGGPDLYPVETAPGARQQIALADGSRIDLNGGTRVMLDRDNPRFARLEQGEALFTVVHDEARPFEVVAAGTTLRDMGTVFNVVADAGSVEVAVAEGAVLFDPGGAAVDLRPGMSLSRTAGQAPRTARIEPAAVSAWHEGRLVYAGAPLARVAADLSRNLGVPVRAGGGAAQRPFTGVIRLDGGTPAVMDRAGTLTGAQARRSGDGWTLTVGAGDTP